MRQHYRGRVPENKKRVESKTQGELCQQQEQQHKEVPKQATKVEGEGSIKQNTKKKGRGVEGEGEGEGREKSDK